MGENSSIEKLIEGKKKQTEEVGKKGGEGEYMINKEKK